jgi:arylsulfatase A-like enzyme
MNRHTRFLAFVLLLCSSIVAQTCKPAKSREFEIFRFTDQLEEQNIIASPLKTLEDSFYLAQDGLTDGWKYMPTLSSETQDVWAASSQYRILGLDSSQKPEGMKITGDGKEIGFIGGSDIKQEGWGWLKTTKNLELRNYKQFFRRRGFRGIIIRAGESFRIIELLPEGEVKISFNISRIGGKNYIPRFVVNLNNEPIESMDLLEPQSIELKAATELGESAIEFKHKIPEKRAGENQDPYILIDSIRIETRKDIILLFAPKTEDMSPPAQEYQASYLTLHSEHDKQLDLTGQEAFSLYSLKENYPLPDLGIERNPHSLKKKIHLGEYAYNALFAPTDSQFMFEVKVPEECFLEFGCGFLEESFSTPRGEVLFRVEIETKGEERTVLFAEKLKFSRQQEISVQKIDLSSYESKISRLYFQTEGIPDKNGSNSSVWINPILFRKAAGTPPNVILVSIDTLRADHLGCYGYPYETSPSLDALAREGVLFRHTFSTTSWTLPSHVALLTSLNTPKHQVINILHKMKDSLPTTADILRNNGYYCAAFTGGGFVRRSYGFSKGFDSFHQIMKGNNLAVRRDEAESLSRRTSAWLDENCDKNFFLFLHTYQPHMPYENNSQAGKMFLDENSRWQKVRPKDIFQGTGKYRTKLSEEDRQNVIALYDGEIRYTDEYLIKPLVEKLKALGIYDNTLLIITSDHGEEFYEHQNWLHGSTLYNESIKIPLIIKFPASRYRGTKVEDIARITDITPTILEEAKVDPGSFDFDGKSLLSLITGKEREERIFYADLIFRRLKDTAPQMFATNRNGLKIIQSNKTKSTFTKKFAADIGEKKVELYDLEKDQEELTNLANRRDYQELCLTVMENIARYYQVGAGQKAQSITIDEELRQTLKALGYIR